MERHPSSSTAGRNRILQMLPASDLALLEPDLERDQLKRDHVCIEVGKPIEYVYFLDGGLASSVIPDQINGTSEVGMQGYEGLVGIPVLLGTDQSPHKIFMQVGGPVRRIRVAPLRQAMGRSASLRALLLLYVQVFLMQTAETAHANARLKLEDRLARWILMSADRLGPEIELTHGYLSYMLGVRRPSVTEALHVLEGERLIKSLRSLVVVRDRAGLEARAGRSYGAPETEYERLIGPCVREAAFKPEPDRH